MINKNQLVILAMLEGLVMFSAVGRIAIPGLGLDLANRAHLIWLVVTLMLAGGSVAHFVVRNAALKAREPGQSVEEDRKQIFIVSLAILAGAAMLSVAGPHSVARLLS